jgi:hypothetical protein
MVIFHSYVSLPEGIPKLIIVSSIRMEHFSPRHSVFGSPETLQVAPAELNRLPDSTTGQKKIIYNDDTINGISRVNPLIIGVITHLRFVR